MLTYIYTGHANVNADINIDVNVEENVNCRIMTSHMLASVTNASHAWGGTSES